MKKYHIPIFGMTDAVCSRSLKAAKGEGEFRKIGNELCKAKGSDNAMRNVWKRSLSLLLAMVMVLSAVPMGALAEEVVEEEFFEEETGCDHASYEETDYVSPDCTTAGYIEYTCLDCGESWTEEEEAYGHDYWDGVCTSCGAIAPEGTVEEAIETYEGEYAISAQAAALAVDMKDIPTGAKKGLIWLDKEDTNGLLNCVLNGGLRELVLNAIDEDTEGDTKVFYGDADVTNIVALMTSGVQGDLEEALSAYKALPFTIKRTGKADETVYIICRNISNLNVEVTAASVESKGCPDDLAGNVNKALTGATIKITHNGDDLTELALAKGTVTITRKSGSSFSWPETAGDSITVKDAITVAITGDLGYPTVTRYGSLTLKDTTKTCTVTYYKATGETYKTYSVAEGSAIPVPEEEPERKYYKFAGWDDEPEGTVTKDLTFNALWQPNLDENKDNIADQEQSFEITFDYNYPEGVDGEPDEVTVSIPWGTVISGYKGSDMPANPTLDGYVFQGWEGGTAKVTRNATVKATWAEDTSTGGAAQEYTVTYHLMDGKTTFQLSTQGGKAIKVPYTSTTDAKGRKNDYVIFKGWYADAAYTNEYNFTNDVKENMDLYGLWKPDENNNSIEDGTAEDPYIINNFWLEPEGTANNDLMTYQKYFTKDGNYDSNFDPNSETYKAYYTPGDSLDDDDIFVKWELKVEGEENQKVRNYYPVFTAERNRNGIADNLEQTALVGMKLNEVDYNNVVESITFGGETVSFANPFARDSKNSAELKITTKPGYVVTAVTYSEKSTTATTSLYEDEVVGNGETNLELSYSADNQTVTTTVPVLAASDSESKYYALHIYFRNARELVLKETPTLNLNGLSTITDEVVYNAAVDTESGSPAYDADKVEIQYVAREAMSGKVDVQKLYDAVKPYESMVPGVWNYLVTFLDLKQEGTRWYYCYELDEVTCGLDDVKTIQRTPQQIVDNYIADMAATVDVTKINELASTLVKKKQVLDDQLGSDTCHAFGSQSEETVNITYTESPWTLTAEDVTININDNRADTSLTVNGFMTFEYGKATKSAVIGQLTLSSNVSSDEITLSDENIATKGVGTYTITASFPGDASRKSCSVTFDLTIDKAIAKVQVPGLWVHQESFAFDGVKATVEDSNGNAVDAAVLQIIAGLDATSLDLNLTAPVVSDLTGKAWVIAPDGLDDLLEAALQKLGYSTSESITLSQFTDLVTRHRDVLETRLSATNVDRLISFLTNVSAYVDAQMNIVFAKPEDVPTGVYLNLAVLADPNYKGSVDVTDTSSVNGETEFAYGGIVISPVVAIPNRGGVQLVRGATGKAENIFAFGAGESVALNVTVDGKKVDNATIYYYGVTGAAAVYNHTEAPKNAGLYVAATVYYSADGSKIGSDSAIVIVGKYEADMTIYNTVVAQKENATFAPTYDVTWKDANKTKGNPDIIMISGTVTKANDSDKLDLSLLKGDVYVDVPQWLGNLWNTFVTSQAGVSLGLTVNDATNPVISKRVLTGFLDWCIKRVESTENAVGKAVSKLNSLGVNDALTGKLDNIPDWLTNNLQKAREQANKLPDGGKVIHINTYTSKDGNHIHHYGEVGVYYYVGIIADSDYLPAVAAGGLVITEDEDALVLWDTEVPWDGKGHEPIANITKDAMQMAMTIVRDESDKSLTILMDKDLMNALGLEENETLTLNALIGEKGEGAQSGVEGIVEKMESLAKTKLPKRFGDEVEDAAQKLTALSNKMKEQMVEQLQKLAEDVTDGNATKSFIVKEHNADKLPKDIGKYTFATFTYGMVYDTARLTIHPIYFTVNPVDASKQFGEEDPDFTATIDFYTFESKKLQDGTVVTNKVDAGEEYQDDYILEQFSYTIEREKGETVGTYKMTVANAEVVNNEWKESFVPGEEHGTGTFTIKQAVKTLTLMEDLTKYYDGTNDEVEVTKTLDDGTKVTYTLTYTNSIVGQWPLTVKKGSIKVEPENYDVTVDTNGKKMVISPAEVTIKIHDLSRTFEDTKGEMVSALDYTVVNSTNEKFDKDYLKNNSIIALKVADLDSLLPNDKLPIGTYDITCECKSNNFKIIVEDEKGTLTVDWGDIICWNVDTGVYYDDVSDALSEATSGQTVQMLADAPADMFMIPGGITLDLNGYYVTANYVAAFGTVMDSEPTASKANAFESTVADGEVKSGGIVITSGNVMVAGNNGGYMPIYDTVTRSYKFFKGGFANENPVINKSGTALRFYSQIHFESNEGYTLLARTEKSGINIVAKLSWPGVNDEGVDVLFTFAAKDVKDHAANMPGENSLYVQLTGVNKLVNSEITARMFATGAGYEYRSDTLMSYKIS